MKAALWIAAILGIVFGILRIWFIDFHRVPTDRADARNWANAPSLEPGDFVLVWRGEPHVGDLVRCPDPSDSSRWLVARIVGVGGDKIEWNEAGLRINNFRLNTSSCVTGPRKLQHPELGEVELTCQGEELGSTKHDSYTSKDVPMFTETVVEAGKIFVVSDNRVDPWTHDSRLPEVGQVPLESCQQRLLVRMWSAKGWGDSERRLTFLW